MEQIKEKLGENIISIVKYKLGVEEKILFVTDELTIQILEQIKPHFKDNYLFLTKAELEGGSDVFPLEFLHIKNNYQLVHGKDIIASLKFDKKHIRRELEFEFRSKLIHLREQYLASKSKAQKKELILSAPSALTPILEGLLFLTDAKMPKTADGIFDLIKEKYGVDASIFRRIEMLIKGEMKIKTEEIKNYINELMVVLTNLSEKLDKLKI